MNVFEETFERLVRSLDEFPGGSNESRVNRILDAMCEIGTDEMNEEMKKARIVKCSDERTGIRFGQALCRKGKCLKIGSGGRKNVKRYQLWMDWSGRK